MSHRIAPPVTRMSKSASRRPRAEHGEATLPAVTCTDIGGYVPASKAAEVFRPASTPVPAGSPAAVPSVTVDFRADGRSTVLVVGTLEALRAAGCPGVRSDLDDTARGHHESLFEVPVSLTDLRTIVARQVRTGNADTTVELAQELFDVLADAVARMYFRPTWDTDAAAWRATTAFPPSVYERLLPAHLDLIDEIQPIRYVAAGLAFIRALLRFAEDEATQVMRGGELPAQPTPAAVRRLWLQRLQSLAGGDTPAWTLTPPSEPSGVWLVDLRVHCSRHAALVEVDTEGAAQSDHEWAHQQLVAATAAVAGDIAPVSWDPSHGPVELSAGQVEQFVATMDRWRAAGVDVVSPGVALHPTQVTPNLRVGGQANNMMAEGLELTLTADVEGHPLTAADVAVLADNATATLVHTSRGWMATPTNIDELVRLAALVRTPQVTAADIVHADLGAEVELTVDVPGWVGDVLRGEPPLAPIDPVALPEPFDVVLSDDQKEGVTWLNWCETNQVGGVLADSMGRGRSCQLLAQICIDHAGPTLVVAPTSLLDNWEAEAAKFAPDLSVARYYGPDRNLRLARQADIVLTTYTLLSRDRSVTVVDWHRVILDEAQAVKNPQTKAGKVVAQLRSPRRFAVTDTAVENHLGDLWALFNVVQPGLLGSFASFQRRYITGADAQSDERLARMIAPFILRRRKTDDGIAPELPD